MSSCRAFPTTKSVVAFFFTYKCTRQHNYCTTPPSGLSVRTIWQTSWRTNSGKEFPTCMIVRNVCDGLRCVQRRRLRLLRHLMRAVRRVLQGGIELLRLESQARQAGAHVSRGRVWVVHQGAAGRGGGGAAVRRRCRPCQVVAVDGGGARSDGLFDGGVLQGPPRPSSVHGLTLGH